MPSVFLSYSRKDLSLVEQLETQLKNAPDVSVWRDQKKLYGGDKWPKVLGEAIADQDVFLLVWSKNSDASHFVEFEWTTAIALKKTIIPCLLDSTPLPPSLRATNAISISDSPKIVPALTGAGFAEDRGRRAEVVSKLGQITTTKPRDVLDAAKALFDQRNWTVQGNVIQGENVTVQIEQRSGESAKGFLEKWQTWVGVVVGVLTAVTLVVGLIDKMPGPNDDAGMFLQSLDGRIFDKCTQQPIPGVTISLSRARQTQTDQTGNFHLEVEATKQEQVTFTAQKPGYESYSGLASVGLNPVSINLSRKC